MIDSIHLIRFAMRPYFYSDFLSTYVKVFFTDKKYPLDKQFLDELFHFIQINPDGCINSCGEFLESTIHANVVIEYLMHYFYVEKNDTEKYAFLYEYAKTKNIRFISGNLLEDKFYAFRMMRNLYETYTLN